MLSYLLLTYILWILANKQFRLPTKNGLLDWDCAEAIDIPAMAESLAYIRQHAAFPVSPFPCLDFQPQ
jgi:uridine kinase